MTFELCGDKLFLCAFVFEIAGVHTVHLVGNRTGEAKNYHMIRSGFGAEGYLQFIVVAVREFRGMPIDLDGTDSQIFGVEPYRSVGNGRSPDSHRAVEGAALTVDGKG